MLQLRKYCLYLPQTEPQNYENVYSSLQPDVRFEQVRQFTGHQAGTDSRDLPGQCKTIHACVLCGVATSHSKKGMNPSTTAVHATACSFWLTRR